jgi:hypothetical protein
MEGARQHDATYAHDKRSGNYNVRVVGPNCNRFAGREVPVRTKAGEEKTEKLVKLLWTGPDKDVHTQQPTGKTAALYSFAPRPRDDAEDEIPF